MQSKKIIMLGATGAVGNHTALVLSKISTVNTLTLLGRNPVDNLEGDNIHQHKVDIFSPSAYESIIDGHNTAICTLGVGQPSKVSKEDFVKIDKNAVLDFARACKKAGVSHFELLSSVGASSSSNSFYLRTKGELEDALQALEFERLSLFQPSMIITPTNRYGLSQAFVLAVMPLLDPVFIGPLKKYRSILVERLGAAIAMNLFKAVEDGRSAEILNWSDFIRLSKTSKDI